MTTKSLAEMIAEHKAEDQKLTALLQAHGVQVLGHNGSVKISGDNIKQAHCYAYADSRFSQIWLQVELGSHSDVLVLVDPHNKHWLIDSDPVTIFAIAWQSLPLTETNLKMLQSERETVKGRLAELNAILNFQATLNTARKG